MSRVSNIEFQYTTELVELLRLGDKELLKSRRWDKGEFEKRFKDVLKSFPEINEYVVSLYFTHHRAYTMKAVAETHLPEYPIDEDENSDLAELQRARPGIFIINYWRDIFSFDEIAQEINIAHEFQHISQYVRDKKHYLFARIIHWLVGGYRAENLPTEIDAEIKSKRLIGEKYEKARIDEWITARLDERPHTFFIRFRDYDVDFEYDLKEEVTKLWETYHLQNQIEILKKAEKRTDDQERVLKMYFDAIKGNE